MAITMMRIDEAPRELQDLHDDSNGPPYWVVIGDRNDDEPRTETDFRFVIETMDEFCAGADTVHSVEYLGRPVYVYIIADDG